MRLCWFIAMVVCCCLCQVGAVQAQSIPPANASTLLVMSAEGQVNQSHLIHRQARLSGTSRRLAHRSLGRIKQAQEAEPENLLLISSVIGGTMAGLLVIPLVGNIHALASGKGQTGWGIGGLVAVGFLSCMVGYIAGTANFYLHKTYWYAQLPMWGLSLGVMALSIANLAIGRQKDRKAKTTSSVIAPITAQPGQSQHPNIHLRSFR